MKKSFLICLLSLTCISLATSQTKYVVVDFSDSYSLEYVIAQESEEASPEYYILKEPVTNKILLEYGYASLKKFAHEPKAKKNNYNERQNIKV